MSKEKFKIVCMVADGILLIVFIIMYFIGNIGLGTIAMGLSIFTASFWVYDIKRKSELIMFVLSIALGLPIAFLGIFILIV